MFISSWCVLRMELRNFVVPVAELVATRLVVSKHDLNSASQYYNTNITAHSFNLG